METDQSVFFLTADMGINLVERFGEAYPQRFLNVGIAEQNLIGVSAGLCNAGFRPVAYTISNFITHRCFEQIRNDVALHAYPVIMLGTSSGFDNAPLGPTHHIIDDWGAIAGIPGIDIYCPASTAYAETLIDRLIDAGRPAYVRIPKGAPAEPLLDADIVYMPAAEPDVLLVTYGSPAAACLAVAGLRRDVSVLVINKLKPLRWRDVATAFGEHREIIVVEDHFPEQGLFGTLARLAVEAHVLPSLHSIAPQRYNFTVGRSAAYYEALYRLDARGVMAAVDELAGVTV